MTKQNVWVLIFEHHHGASASLWDSRESGEIAVLQTMKESRYWKDVAITDHYPKLRALANSCADLAEQAALASDEETLDEWAELTGGDEKIRLEKMTVASSKRNTMDLQSQIDAKLKEAVKLARADGYLKGVREAFRTAYLIMEKHGHADLCENLRGVAKTWGAPLDEDGKPVEVEIGECPRCKTVTAVFETEAPRYDRLCGACDNTPEAHEPA